jgi:hypothetical protein
MLGLAGFSLIQSMPDMFRVQAEIEVPAAIADAMGSVSRTDSNMVLGGREFRLFFLFH